MSKRLSYFGPYTLDFATEQLLDGNRKVSLPPKHFGVLKTLVRAGGEVVTKEQFHASLWKGSFVEEGNLTQIIFLLRRTLGKQTSGEEYIKTVSRRGYRFDPSALKSEASSLIDSFRTPSRSDAQEERYRLLVDSIDEYAIYMLDCGGRVRSWNPGAESLKGYTAAETIGQHYSLFFTAEDIEGRLPEKHLRVAAQDGRVSGEGWRLRKNGERFWATFVITAMRDSDRKLVGFAKVVRDITFRKRQEEDLLRMEALVRRERDRLSAAAESSMDAFYICEALRNSEGEIEDFVFTYLNSNVEKMVSIPRNTLLNSRMCEVLPVNRTAGLFDEYRKVAETGEPYIAEFPVTAENVLSEWVRVQAVRLEDGVAITASDITERKRSEAKILRLAHEDPLTGLTNRSLLDDRISQSIERVKRYGGQVTVCLLDLNDFKAINDQYGHQTGDAVLVEVAHRLRGAVRALDSVIRIGGDEFVVVLPDDATRYASQEVIERLRSAILEPMNIDGHDHTVGCSLGWSIYPGDGDSVGTLLSVADKAMYRAKLEGKLREEPSKRITRGRIK